MVKSSIFKYVQQNIKYITIYIYIYIRNLGSSMPEAVVAVVRAPDDGCQHPKHVQLPTRI